MEHVEKERLFKLDPFPGDPNARTVLMSEELLKLTTRPMEEGEDANRRSPLIASLQYIVAGRRLVVCMTPFKARKANLGRLDPIEDSIWDVRCQEKPALRVFCQFVEKDVLFAVTCRPRTVKMDWLGWVPLGDSNSKEWKRGIAATKREWAMYFPAELPVRGDDLDDYISNATLE